MAIKTKESATTSRRGNGEKTKESATTSGQRNADLNIKETKKTSIAYCKPWNPPARKTIVIITLQN
jgi:hypothetical protein